MVGLQEIVEIGRRRGRIRLEEGLEVERRHLRIEKRKGG
jgi:hypothetical protein